MSDADLLRAICPIIYGAQWQTAFANARGITDRTVRRWASGQSPVPAGVWGELLEDLLQHQIQTTEAMALLTSQRPSREE